MNLNFNCLDCVGPDTAGVLDVRIDSGRPGNRMTSELHRELAELWPALARQRDVRAVLVRGSAEAFSAGANHALIDHAVASDATERAVILEETREIVLGLLDCPLPVVAAVRGAAVGAALGVALLSDICVVAEDALLADGHARLGVAAGDHAVLTWPLLCGMARAKRLLMLAEAVSGAEAERIGLVAECRPDAEVEPAARELVARLAAAASPATRWTKRALSHWYRAALPAFESSLAHEMLSYATPAAAEGAASLRDGRPADFRAAGG